MSAPTVQVLMSLNSGASPFTLNSATQGLLNNSSCLLGGPVSTDVSTFLTGQLTISRGRSRETDQYDTGSLTFTLRNESRDFDPTNEDSPYYPGIVPRAQVVCNIAGTQVFGGYVDDVQVQWQKPTISTVKVSCLDALNILANSYLSNVEVVAQTTGQRIEALLSASSFPFPALSAIDEGLNYCQENVMAPLTDTGGSATPDVLLTDMQNIASTEWGFLFVDRTGTLIFYEQSRIATLLADYSGSPVFSDVGTDLADGAYPYMDAGLASATLLLYNQVLGTRNSDALNDADAPQQQEADDFPSQDQYLIRSLNLPSVESADDAAVLTLCQYVLSLYQVPEVRFNELSLELAALSSAQQAAVCELDLTQLCTVKRTPPGGGSPSPISIVSFIEKVGFALDVSGSTYRMTIGLGSTAAYS